MKSIVPWNRSRNNAAPARNDWVDRWLNDPFESFLPGFANSFAARLPSVDVSEDKKEVRVRAEVPGMTEKDIELTWHDGVLSIRGEKKKDKEEQKKDHYYRESSYGSFSRDIAVTRNVDWKKAVAKCKDGVLTVALPKTEAAQRSIEIKVQ